MPAGLPRPSTDEDISTTLSSGITDVAGSMDVADASKIVSPCYLVIDRVDSSGTIKATSLWEYVKVTNVAGNTLTITRGQGGSTGQAHSSGAVVEAVVTSSMFEDWYSVLNPEHDSTGGHVIVGTMTVAGMNLASVATIAKAGIGTLTANIVTIPTFLSVSGASITGVFPSAAVPFLEYSMTAFTSNSTYTTPANSNASTLYRYRMVGGGGGGGGSNTATGNAAGGGGGAYAEGLFIGIAASTGISISVGLGGTAGANTGGNGGTGGLSYIGSPVSIGAGGGFGGTGNTGTGYVAGGGGGVVTGSPQVSFVGGSGIGGPAAGGSIFRGGNGASTPFGTGGIGGVDGSGPVAPSGYGAGGGGGASSTAAGTAGSLGIVVIERLSS